MGRRCRWGRLVFLLDQARKAGVRDALGGFGLRRLVRVPGVVDGGEKGMTGAGCAGFSEYGVNVMRCFEAWTPKGKL